MPTVTKVRKELGSDGYHQHIEGVCTVEGQHFSRREVVDSIARGNVWLTQSPSGSTAVIKPITFCPGTGCMATPYITTRADDQKDDNLENLPPC